MAPVTSALILLILFSAGTLADNHDKPPSEKPGECPPGPLAKCKDPLIGECKSDRGCGGNLKCCRDKCTLKCMKPFTVANIPGKCPVFMSLLPCKTPYTEIKCSGDHHCLGNQKCCDYMCQWQCMTPK
ncbi:antileukoproteinase-like [Bufo bufo]|uniref:antileukoproteinase-like n=1 Tax=Bufo bufo TaxID=8384 RepID=UPI001ABEAB8B|nr:antileukoproteinase-like [Bufo bufo]